MSFGTNLSKSYAMIAEPASHWPYSFPQTDFAQPVSETVRWSPPSVHWCQNTAVWMWPSGYSKLCATIFGIPEVPEVK